MKRHLVIVYWLLLLVSTLAIGGVAFYLLQRESVRMRKAAADSVVSTGHTIKNNLEFLVEDFKTSSMDAISKFPDDATLFPQLVNWRQTNPYARQVFLYRPERGLVLPSARSATDRSAMEPLLHKPNGSWIWGDQDSNTTRMVIASFTVHSIPAPTVIVPITDQSAMNTTIANNFSQMRPDRRQGAPPPNGTGDANKTPNPVQDGLRGSGNDGNRSDANLTVAMNPSPGVPGVNLPETRQGPAAIAKLNALPPEIIVTQLDGNLVLNSNMTPTVQTQWIVSQQTTELVSQGQSGGPPKPDQGWVQVGPSGELRWLGWLRPTPGGPVRGMILSWDAMAKYFDREFPARLDAAAGYILRDPTGRAVVARFANGKMVQAGYGDSPVDDPAAKPLHPPIQTLPLDLAAMPGWALEVYYDPATTFTSGFMTLSTVLVTILVISVLVGGTLLLREARREAFEAARKTSFVSNVSHELKTPLTTIRMYAELLGEGRVRDEAKQHNYLATIIGESQRLTRLVNNVLDFSRLEQGRKQYHPDDLALAPVIENVLEAQRPRLEEAGFEIETDFPYGRDVRVHADRDALEQVLINLIDNAIKYASSGRWLGIKVSVEGERANVTVSDHGPGVPAAHQERIFEVFHRVDDSITSRLPGAGLGLSIARRLLRDQEGDLRYEPNEPHGSSFVASLPLASAISAAKIP